MTSADRRFIRNKTVWEFDDYGHYLYCSFDNVNNSLKPVDGPYWVSFPINYWETEHTRMMIQNSDNGAVTNWGMSTNVIGQGYPNKLILVSPEIVTDLYGSNGSRDKAVTVKVVLTFMR